MSDNPQLGFVRLTEVALHDVLELLNEPRNRKHMPLSSPFTPATARSWVDQKDGQWAANGYGPWAVLVNGQFAGWAGFQAEANGADFALVLAPRFWGHGGEITREALHRGFSELGLTEVLIALPATRSPERVVQRLGFRPAGEVIYGGVTFRQYRLARRDWPPS